MDRVRVNGQIVSIQKKAIEQTFEILWLLTFSKVKMLDLTFSNSLIIHQVKTKEIMTVTVVWIPDLN